MRASSYRPFPTGRYCLFADAIRCFLRTKIDLLVLGHRLYYRADHLDLVNA